MVRQRTGRTSPSTAVRFASKFVVVWGEFLAGPLKTTVIFHNFRFGVFEFDLARFVSTVCTSVMLTGPLDMDVTWPGWKAMR